jgi:MinD superfamily P-loop ATPase
MSLSSSRAIPTIDYERCQACASCAAKKHCRFKAIARLDREEPPYIEVNLCGGCGECIEHCPHKAIVPPPKQCVR